MEAHLRQDGSRKREKTEGDGRVATEKGGLMIRQLAACHPF